MLLRANGLDAAASSLEDAVGVAVQLDEGRTPDIGGRATTRSAGEAVRVALRSAQEPETRVAIQ